MSASRRHLLVGLSAVAAGAFASPLGHARAIGRVVIIGGGFGGATAARTLKRLAPSLDVTLVEPATEFISCPFSNLVIAGQRELASQRFSYRALEREGVNVVHDHAIDISAETSMVRCKDGVDLPYDRVILSPGIDLRWDALEGYDQAAASIMPHAWKAGDQTLLLRAQLQAMDDGGVVAISAPAAPFRCPPGPYERASLIAHYLKTHKPRSKLLILDAKDTFSKKPLFLESWRELYGDMVEWRGASEDGGVTRVDTTAMTLSTDFDDIRVDVANVIPSQKAAQIAHDTGVADATGWCPINPVTFESILRPNIHVIGDATIAAPMPKSAFSANLQGKVCAFQIVRLLAGQAPEPVVLANTCYSYVSPEQAISVAGVYSTDTGKFASIAGAGGISPVGPAPDIRAREAGEAAAWFSTITGEAFG